MTCLERMSCSVDCDICNSSVPPAWTSVVMVSGVKENLMFYWNLNFLI